jgi:hypothetical protein
MKTFLRVPAQKRSVAFSRRLERFFSEAVTGSPPKRDKTTT